MYKNNTKRVFQGSDRGHRNFGPVGRGSFGQRNQNGSQDRQQNFDNSSRGTGRGMYNQAQGRNF